VERSHRALAIAKPPGRGLKQGSAQWLRPELRASEAPQGQGHAPTRDREAAHHRLEWAPFHGCWASALIGLEESNQVSSLSFSPDGWDKRHFRAPHKPHRILKKRIKRCLVPNCSGCAEGLHSFRISVTLGSCDGTAYNALQIWSRLVGFLGHRVAGDANLKDLLALCSIARRECSFDHQREGGDCECSTKPSHFAETTGFGAHAP
jgi:hypothetical protein